MLGIGCCLRDKKPRPECRRGGLVGSERGDDAGEVGAELLSGSRRAGEILLVGVRLNRVVGHEAEAQHARIIVQRGDARFGQHAHADDTGAGSGEQLLVVPSSLKERAAHHHMACRAALHILRHLDGG